VTFLADRLIGQRKQTAHEKQHKSLQHNKSCPDLVMSHDTRSGKDVHGLFNRPKHNIGLPELQ